MPERITKDGIQHIPRRRRLPPAHPAKAALFVLASLAAAAALLWSLTFLAQHYPDAFPYGLLAAILLALLAPLLAALLTRR